MSSVWYVGLSQRRVIEALDWDKVGVRDGASFFSWDGGNGFSHPTSDFTPQQLAWMDAQNEEFWVGAPDGPRTAVVVPPDQFVTLNQLREFLSTYQFPAATGLTKASVGLPNVDNTSDTEKPVSAAAAQALAGKADYPSGGSDGQVMTKLGSTTKWSAPTGSGSVAVTPVSDTDAPSGTVYRITGAGVAQVPDADAPSGYVYSIN